MLGKLLITAVIFGLVWLIFFRPRRGPLQRPGRRVIPHLQLVRCPQCGAYHRPDLPCHCQRGEGR